MTQFTVVNHNAESTRIEDSRADAEDRVDHAVTEFDVISESDLDVVQGAFEDYADVNVATDGGLIDTKTSPEPTEHGDPERTMSNDTTHTVNESNEKVRLKTQVKRGEGTRDQDTHDLKVRGETPEEAAENLSKALRELEERDVFERARNVGNGGNDYGAEHRLVNAEPAQAPDAE